MNSYEQKQADKRDRLLERARNIRGRGFELEAAGRKALEIIPFGQPILVGHHSERGDRAYRGRAVGKIDRGYALMNEATNIERRAEALGSGGISSDDPDAVVKLTAQVEILRHSHARMLIINKVHAAYFKRPDSILSAEISDAERKMVASYVPRYSWEKHPFAPYQIKNSSASIRRIEKRIEQLQTLRAKPALCPAASGAGWTMREDADENRIMFTFPGKPAEDVRVLLRHYAFLWSPSRGAWVRKITPNARFATQQLITRLDKITV